MSLGPQAQRRVRPPCEHLHVSVCPLAGPVWWGQSRGGKKGSEWEWRVAVIRGLTRSIRPGWGAGESGGQAGHGDRAQR